jgi:hypothetical protein
LTELGIGVLSQCLIYRYAQQTLQQIAPSAVGNGGKPDIEYLTQKICDFSLAAIGSGSGAGAAEKAAAPWQLSAN